MREGGGAGRRRGLDRVFLKRARKLRALFEKLAEIDWRDPLWSGFVAALAASEALGARELSAARAAESFVTALQANRSMAADTFMATEVAPPPRDRGRRLERAAARAHEVARALRGLDASAPDQRLLQTLRLEDGGLRPERLPGPEVPLAFIHRERAWVSFISAGPRPPRWIPDALRTVIDGDSHEALTPVHTDDPSPRRPPPRSRSSRCPCRGRAPFTGEPGREAAAPGAAWRTAPPTRWCRPARVRGRG